MEAYENLTLKSLLAMKWTSEYCSAARYLLKCDDDTFVNMPYLLESLHAKASTLVRSIMGPLNVDAEVQRKGKWKLTYDEFPFNKFPPYEGGSAYVITTDVVEKLFETALYVSMIHIDDVYITGILGKIINVTHVSQPGFAHAYSIYPRYCDILLHKIMTVTRLTPIMFYQLWAVLGENNKQNCLDKGAKENKRISNPTLDKFLKRKKFSYY